MKRGRELEERVIEIVQEGRARDEGGQLVYPVMHEPAVLAFFGAPEALFEVLRDRPILVLNLLQANKALEAFWSRFTGIWITWVDMLIEKEMGTYASEIYPFLAMKGGTTFTDFIGFTYKGIHRIHISFVESMYSPTSPFYPPLDPVFYIAYYDETTRLFIEMLTKIGLIENNYLYDYVNADENPFIASLPGCFLISQSEDVPRPPKFSYNIDVFHEALNKLDVKGSLEALLLLNALKTRAERGALPEQPTLLKLDKSVAAPYRALLYDSVQGVCKTQATQKDFFVSVLTTLSKMSNGQETLIERYGALSPPLSCVICRCETQQVDPLLMRAFCTDACRLQYL